MRTDDRFYSHYLIRRLPAEVILDAYSQVTGVPTPFNQSQVGPSGGVAAYAGATRWARGPCSCRTRWSCRRSSTPSAGRSGRRPAPANASRIPASARPCTSTTARRSTTSSGRKLAHWSVAQGKNGRRGGGPPAVPAALCPPTKAELTRLTRLLAAETQDKNYPARGARRPVLGRADLAGIPVQSVRLPGQA